MTTFATYVAKQSGKGLIGDSVAHIIKEVTKIHYNAEVVCVVPRILAYFGSQPERFEVVEADILIKYNE